MEACIACHGSGELPTRANRRLFRFLTTSTASAATATAANRVGATTSVLSAISSSSSSEADVTHFTSERGISLLLSWPAAEPVSCQLLAAMEIRAKQCDKEGTLWSSKHKKSSRVKMGLPSTSEDSKRDSGLRQRRAASSFASMPEWYGTLCQSGMQWISLHWDKGFHHRKGV